MLILLTLLGLFVLLGLSFIVAYGIILASMYFAYRCQSETKSFKDFMKYK